MNATYACFSCGDTGHIKSECPNRTPIANPPPGTPQGAPEITCCLKCGSKGIHTRTCGYPPSTPARIAETLNALGLDRSPKVITPFREWAGLRPKSEAELRALARRQVEDAQAERGEIAGAVA